MKPHGPTHLTEETLNDYVDGLLGGEQRREAELHLASCATCHAEVDELRALIRRAATLPEVAPARDLLPDIRAAVPSRRPSGRTGYTWGALAAAILLIAVAVGVLWRGVLPVGPGPEDGSAAGNGGGTVRQVSGVAARDAALAVFLEAEREFVEAGDALLEVLESRRESLPPETFAALEKNLATLDDAIADVRAALDVEDSDPATGQILTALYHKRMQLLWKASRLSS